MWPAEPSHLAHRACYGLGNFGWGEWWPLIWPLSPSLAKSPRPTHLVGARPAPSPSWSQAMPLPHEAGLYSLFLHRAGLGLGYVPISPNMSGLGLGPTPPHHSAGSGYATFPQIGAGPRSLPPTAGLAQTPISLHPSPTNPLGPGWGQAMPLRPLNPHGKIMSPHCSGDPFPPACSPLHWSLQGMCKWM